MPEDKGKVVETDCGAGAAVSVEAAGAFAAAVNLPLDEACGKEALCLLAARFPQLYLKPVPEDDIEAIAVIDEAHRMAVKRGQVPEKVEAKFEGAEVPEGAEVKGTEVPEGALLGHFVSTSNDWLRVVDTPAGPVQVLYLACRKDFETFLQCVGCKGHAVPIAPTIGAITYRGLNDWRRVEAAKAAYLNAGGTKWLFDMVALSKQKAFRSELIVISEGPYSNLPASATPYNEAQWLEISREIRLHHECAHVACRRLAPEKINPLWDEITADAVGLLMATGTYDCELAAAFLGVSEQGYTGGRIIEYVDADQRESIDEYARKAYADIIELGKRAVQAQGQDPFEFLLDII